MSDTQTPKEKSGSKAPLFIVLILIIAVSAGGLFYMNQTDKLPAGDSSVAENVKGEAEELVDVVESQVDAEEKAMAEAEAPMSLPFEQEPVEIKEGNPVVAKVNSEEIKRSEVMEFISKLPDQLKALPLQTTFPLALEEVVADRVVKKRIAQSKINDDPEVQELVQQAQTQIVRSVYLEREIKKALTEDKLREEYDRLISDIDDVKETKARHILLEEEAIAKEVIQKLKDGADFSALAQEYSTGPTGQNGGDLGYFAKSQMVPEFADAAFDLKVGEFSADPVKTQFGYHVILAEDRRNVPKPSFEEVKPQIEQKLSKDVAVQLLSDWKQQADVQKFDINGEPVTAE